MDLKCAKQAISAENIPYMYISEQELSIHWWSRRQFDFARAIRLYEIGTALDNFNCGKFNGHHRFAVRIMQFSVGTIFTLLHTRSRYVHGTYTRNILWISPLKQSAYFTAPICSQLLARFPFVECMPNRKGRFARGTPRVISQKQIKRTPPDLRGRIPRD